MELLRPYPVAQVRDSGCMTGDVWYIDFAELEAELVDEPSYTFCRLEVSLCHYAREKGIGSCLASKKWVKNILAYWKEVKRIGTTIRVDTLVEVAERHMGRLARLENGLVGEPACGTCALVLSSCRCVNPGEIEYLVAKTRDSATPAKVMRQCDQITTPQWCN